MQTEYAYHNAVQYIKKELRNYVKEQKMLKGMLRDELFEYAVERDSVTFYRGL